MIGASKYPRMAAAGTYAEDNAGLGGLTIHFSQSRSRLGGYHTSHQQSIRMPG